MKMFGLDEFRLRTFMAVTLVFWVGLHVIAASEEEDRPCPKGRYKDPHSRFCLLCKDLCQKGRGQENECRVECPDMYRVFYESGSLEDAVPQKRFSPNSEEEVKSKGVKGVVITMACVFAVAGVVVLAVVVRRTTRRPNRQPADGEDMEEKIEQPPLPIQEEGRIRQPEENYDEAGRLLEVSVATPVEN